MSGSFARQRDILTNSKPCDAPSAKSENRSRKRTLARPRHLLNFHMRGTSREIERAKNPVHNAALASRRPLLPHSSRSQLQLGSGGNDLLFAIKDRGGQLRVHDGVGSDAEWFANGELQ